MWLIWRGLCDGCDGLAGGPEEVGSVAGEHGADGVDEVGGVGHLHEGVDGGREGVGFDGDEADVRVDGGLNGGCSGRCFDGDGTEVGRGRKRGGEGLGKDGGPAAGGDLRGEYGGGVGEEEARSALEPMLCREGNGGAEEGEGKCGDVVPCDARTGGSGGGGEEEEALAVEGEGVEAIAGGVVDVGEGDVELALAEGVEEFGVGRGLDGELDGGILLCEGDAEDGGEGGGGGQHAEAEDALHALIAEFVEFLLEAIAVFEHLLGPGEDAFAFGGEALKALAALDDADVHVFFQLLDARGERGLRDAAGSGGAGEVALLVEGEQVFEVADDHGGEVPVGGRGLG